MVLLALEDLTEAAVFELGQAKQPVRGEGYRRTPVDLDPALLGEALTSIEAGPHLLELLLDLLRSTAFRLDQTRQLICKRLD